jgi:hypothetical protein
MRRKGFIVVTVAFFVIGWIVAKSMAYSGGVSCPSVCLDAGSCFNQTPYGCTGTETDNVASATTCTTPGPNTYCSAVGNTFVCAITYNCSGYVMQNGGIHCSIGAPTILWTNQNYQCFLVL